MKNANTQFYDKAVDRAAMIRLFEEHVKGKVELTIDGHVVRVDKLIREAHASEAGFRRLRNAIDKELQKTYKTLYTNSKRSLLDLATDQMSYTYQSFEAAYGKIWRTARPNRTISADIVLSRPLHADATLLEGWARVSVSERKRLEDVIRKGMAEGLSMEEIAKQVRKGNVHNITRNQSRALVTTAMTSVVAQSDHEVYKANKGALQGWQYVAVLDSRTTPICAHRNGQIYEIGQTEFLPPAHYHCRSKTVPVFKSWDDVAKLEGAAQVRRRNLKGLSERDKAFFDGMTPMGESYHDWLWRQPQEVQLRHLGDYEKVKLFHSGKLTADKFIAPSGKTLSIRELRSITDSGYDVAGDTARFARAKAQLDAMHLGAASPDDFLHDPKLAKTLEDYYLLQAGELDGTLSTTNYRGMLLSSKQSMKKRVLTSPPRDEQLVYNPITGRYDDVRLYQPAPEVHANNLRLVKESELLTEADKAFIQKMDTRLADRMSMNERSAVMDNLRITFSRYRKKPEPWANFKAVSNAQMKFDVMNVSDAIETHLRRDADVLKRLAQDSYVDPVLGTVQLDDLHDNLIKNIRARNKWEDSTAPKIARQLRNFYDYKLRKTHPIIMSRLDDRQMQQFYLRYAHRLSLADSPDRDQFAITLGRDLYNLANLNGTRDEWYELGMQLVDEGVKKKLFEIDAFGVQKRRMKSRLSSRYFGPYYDTVSFNIRVTDPRLREYSQLTRKVELGMRVAVTTKQNRLVIREGYKTYFTKTSLGLWEDTRIPITSTTAFSDFPEEFIDKNLVDALNWTAQAEYKVDKDYYDFVKKLLYFEDDKGRAKHFNELNEYRKYITSRGDTYERFKAMEWLRQKDAAFSNHPFIDHRARIYDRGLIGPQSGETFRPFLNTAKPVLYSPEEYRDLQDQIGAFLGGLNDKLEGRFNSLTITGRQKIARMHRDELIRIGTLARRGKPNDIRQILESPILAHIDGEEQGKFFRFAIEMSKIDEFIGGDYSVKGLEKLRMYEMHLALEQDASSSGAQIIAITTRNKQLAEMSNVVPTNQKRRLYDEIAAATFNDPRFRELNKRLGLTEKELRKAAKAQNMVSFYGAGEKTGAMNVESKLAKALGKDEGVLVVRASDRDLVLNEIDARIARYERFDPDTTRELKVLRANVRDVFNKGLTPGHDIVDQLYFLDPKTRDLVEKMSRHYDKVVTPDDFKKVAEIMSEHLAEEVPILQSFTKFFGRLAEDYLAHARPKDAAIDWKKIAAYSVRDEHKKGYVLPDWLSEALGVKAGEPVSAKFLKASGMYNPNSGLNDFLYGVKAPTRRTTGRKWSWLKIKGINKGISIEVMQPNKMPKRWTNIPWVNFDGKTLEQNFTQVFEERLVYTDPYGNRVTNILQVPQKTEATWWEQVINDEGNINDIADLNKARTAYGVNGNHSNDAVIVKKFHLWGRKHKVPTSTIHDAFFANAGNMLEARRALRQIYAESLDKNIIRETLLEMRRRGLPKHLYDQYLNEAIELGLIPVPGKSKIGGKVVQESDLLKREDILKSVPEQFDDDYGWYGVG